MPDYRHILWDGRRWILAAVLLFVAGALLGFGWAALQPDLVLHQIQPFVGLLRDVGERLTGTASPLERTSVIFRNNGLAVMRMMLFGLFPVPFFGFWPAAGTFGNGLLLGIIVGLGGRISPLATSPETLLLATLPHGVIELPAVWIAAAWGMKLGLAWLLPGAAGQRLRVLGHSALEAAQIFVLVAILLLLAAAIEANVTLALVQNTRTAPGIL
jgi:stage II sporulation protein M